MNKIKILYLAADPISQSSGTRLRLDEEIRAVRKKVRTAKYGDAVELDVHWAVRAADLLDTLNDVRPDVLHFSGHGRSEGIILVGADVHRPHLVDGETLVSLLKATGSKIRLVVLSSASSLALAQVITSVADCAIGIRTTISDDGASVFNATFYGALASGYSVQTAFDHARAQLKLADATDSENVEMIAGAGVDPSKLVLLSDTEASTVGNEKAIPRLVVSPTVFTIPTIERELDLVSVMMPFAKDFAETYQAIERACANVGLRCQRGDTVWQESTVIQDVFNLIYRSAVIVVDLSDHNANVMYECGIAHTLGRPVVPISRSTGKDTLAFDLAHHRVLHYLPNSQGHTQMRKQLEKRLRSLTAPAS
jgi:hypothetical protein